MKIEINLKIIPVLILFLLLNNIDTYIIFLIFILIHELAHLFIGIMIGGKPRKLNLNPLGVSLEFYSYGKNKLIYKVLFYLAGPFVNFIIAIIFMYLEGIKGEYEKIIYTNLAICIFNLIPILPLDGGKILKEILRVILGIGPSNKFMIVFSKCFLFAITFTYSIVIVKLKNVYLLILIGYLWYLYHIEEKKYNIFKKTSDSIKRVI